MPETLEICDSVPADFGAIELLYPDAFPDEDLLPLVRDLLPDTTVTTSIIGEIDSRIIGHVSLVCVLGDPAFYGRLGFLDALLFAKPECP